MKPPTPRAYGTRCWRWQVSEVRVGVDQPGHQHGVAEIVHVPHRGGVDRAESFNGDDAPVLDHQVVLFEHLPGHRNEVSSGDENAIGGSHAGGRVRAFAGTARPGMGRGPGACHGPGPAGDARKTSIPNPANGLCPAEPTPHEHAFGWFRRAVNPTVEVPPVAELPMSPATPNPIPDPDRRLLIELARDSVGRKRHRESAARTTGRRGPGA